jgi:agmatinase
VTSHQRPSEIFEYPQRPGRFFSPQEGTFSKVDWERAVAQATEFGLEAAPSIQDRTISTFSREISPTGGMKTFLKAPHLEDVRNVGEYDGAILGVPLDTGRSHDSGTRLGPQSIRRISTLCSPYHFELDLDIREHISLCDLGDVFVIPSDLTKSFDQISRAVSHIFRSGTFPIVLGGDRAISYPAMRGLAPHIQGKVALIHFGVDAQEATTYHSKQVPRASIKICREQETVMLSATDIYAMGLDRAVDRALSIACEGNDAVYMSVDIGSIHTGVSPKGGLTSLLAPHEALYMIQRMAREAPLCGLEVVEVSPAHDVSDMTSLMATQVVMEVLAALVAQDKLPRPVPNWLNASANESWSL